MLVLALLLAGWGVRAEAQTITGTVTDAATGVPLSGAYVYVFDASNNYVMTQTTNASGVYSATVSSAGTYYLVTWNNLGYVDELYNNFPCSNIDCYPYNLGTGVVVTAGGTTSGVNFALAVGGNITGAVWDAATGAPLSGVSVNVYSATGSSMGGGSTNASGIYTKGGLPTGTYFVRTSNSQGYIDELYDNMPCPGGNCSITSGTSVSVTIGATTGGINFGLALGGRVSGTVTNAATGAPLSNIEVDIYTSSGSAVTYGYTNASGVYTSGTGLPTGTYYVRTYNSQGYINELYNDIPCAPSCTITSGTAVSVTIGATISGVNFGLAVGGGITGTVTDAGTGAPLSGVSVSVYNSSGSSMGSVSTNTSGVYTTSGLPAGTYYVRTSNYLGFLDELYNNLPCPGGRCTVTSGTGVGVTAGATTGGINFGLATGGRISGTVTDATTGAPLQNVEVDIYNSSGSYVTYGYTDASGVYASGTGLPTGTYYLRTYNSQGYLDELYNNILCASSCTITSGTGVSVTIGATTSGVNFGLAMGGNITGAVWDAATGAPLSGVTVNVYNASGSSMGSVSTNTSGVYSRNGLPTGTYYVRTSNSLGYIDELYDNLPCPNGSCTVTTGTGVSVTAGATRGGINFGLAVGGGISGTVSDAVTGAPLSGVSVYVYNASGNYMGSVATNASGVYTKTGLATGTYNLWTYNTQGYLDELYNNLPCLYGTCSPYTAGTGVSVTVGTTTGGINFGLAVGGRISGVVTNAATGAPLSNVSVFFYNTSGSQIATASTNASGAYTSGTGLPTGTYYVRTSNTQGYVDKLYNNIACPGGNCSVTSGTAVSVTAGATTGGINFGLAAGGYISGTVTDAATGAPLSGVSVYVYNAAGSRVSTAYTASSGVYTTSYAVAPGTYYVRTVYSGTYVDEQYDNVPCPYSSCPATSGTGVPVTAGATTSGINFALAVGGRISGTVTDAVTGTPLASVYAYVYNASGSFVSYGYTNSSGMYTTYYALPTGTYFVVTWNYAGYLDELYNNIPCPASTCSVTGGAGVSVTAGGTTSGIDFALVRGLPGGDFTGDSMSDILWRHGTSGDVWIWPMNGGSRYSESYVATVPDTNFEIRGQGDLNGDRKADLLWRHKTAGLIYYWPMNGTIRLAENYVATVDIAYDIIGTGDFNGDGKADLLWRNPTAGDLWIWLMNGPAVLSQTYVDTVDPTYKIKGIGDLNGDGKADLVWAGAAGDVWVWPMNGTTAVSHSYVGTVPDANYQIQQVVDFNGDGKADLLWWNQAAGDLWIWLMSGTTKLSENYVGVVPDTNYRIVGAGDYDGNGKADLLWYHRTLGEVWVWLMNGTVKLSENWVGTVPDLGYQIVKAK
jgi:5-hydroxyisourate hydrolase-like protein (transthyretin family)